MGGKEWEKKNGEGEDFVIHHAKGLSRQWLKEEEKELNVS